MILVSDANVLIDMADGSLLEAALVMLSSPGNSPNCPRHFTASMSLISCFSISLTSCATSTPFERARSWR